MAKDLEKQAKYEKKRAKAELKRQKREQKAAKSAQKRPIERKKDRSFRVVKFARSIRGILFLTASVFIFVAIVLADKGYIISFEDIFDSFVAAKAGKAVLAIVSVVFFVLGLKNIRATK